MDNIKQKLFEIISLSENELKKEKIGIMVRATLPIILSEKLISELEIHNLTKAEYCKSILDINYPVLREYNDRKNITENRLVNDHTRYYAYVYKSGNRQYLICSEWYERSVIPYIKWLKRKVKTEQN